jgi:hypothetical protein
LKSNPDLIDKIFAGWAASASKEEGKPSKAAPVTKVATNTGGKNEGGKEEEGSTPRAEEWECEKCGEKKEDPKKSFCLKCASWGGFGSIQGDGDVPFPENFVQEDDDEEEPGWICLNCTHKNKPEATYCDGCATVHARATHVATKDQSKQGMAVMALDHVEKIDGKKDKTKWKMDGHSGAVSTASEAKERVDGNTGSTTKTVVEGGKVETTHIDNGPDKKNENRWTCTKCSSKNLQVSAHCQNCATLRNRAMA